MIRVIFDEYGGYDAMSAAYSLERDDGGVLLVVDVRGYTEGKDWDTLHQENAEAKRVADICCEALNAEEKRG